MTHLRCVRGALLFAALPFLCAAQVTDPRITSWWTTNSTQYARVYETASDKTSGNAVSTWPRSGLTNGGGGQATPAYSDVQRVAYSSTYVYIYTTGLASYPMGNWLTPNGQTYTSWPANRGAIHRIPRTPTIPTTKQKNNGSGGVLVNGVFVWQNGDAQSYANASSTATTATISMSGDGIWNRLAGVAEAFNFDAAYGHQPSSGAYHNHINPIGLRYQLGDNVTYNSSTKTYSESGTPTRHSPIIGWANDGLPIYGPYGYSSAMDATSAIRRMTTGFVKRNAANATAYGTDDLAVTGRVKLPVWAASVQGKSQTLTPSQYGPTTTATYSQGPVSYTCSIGVFAEDYEYLGDLGKVQGTDFDLNRQNVRFCVTPEFPSGTYAYFTCIDASGNTVFPDVINQEYFGTAPAGQGTVTSITETVTDYARGGPAKPITLGATASGGGVALTWNSAEGATYKVESSPDTTTWTTLSSAVTSGGASTSYTASAVANYFRVTLTAIATYDTNGTYGVPVGTTTTTQFGSVAVAPSIATPPASASVSAGASVTFSVSVGGTAPFTYQWSKDNTPISGATTSTYTIASAQTTDNGSYTCVVTNSAGSATSSAATLTVSPVVTAPTITTPPASASVIAGSSVTFTVVASGTAPLTYQWSKGGNPISGATTASYTIASAQTIDNGSYTCAVTNSAGTATSAAAVLTVTPAATAPTITTPPADATITAGANVTFTVTAGGTTPLSYQWQKDGTPISGATAASYTITGAQTTQSGSYTVVVTNSAGSITSPAAALVVNPVVSPPTITVPPVAASVLAGGTATFSVAASGTAPLSYQWLRGGVPISGATLAILVITNAQTADAALYSVTVTNGQGSVTSTGVALTVVSTAVAPVIVTQPVSQTVTAGGSATLAVVAAGTQPLSYQWFRNGSPLNGANAATLTIAGAQAVDAGTYSVFISNSAGSVTSSTVSLTVEGASIPPSIVVEPVEQTVRVGASVSFSVTAAGTAPLRYQWLKDGVAIAGATSATLTLSRTTARDAGLYSVAITNNFGTNTSRAVRLTITGVSYAGTYFGTFNGGTFALYLRDDNTGTFLAYGAASGLTIVARSVTIDAGGRLRFSSLQAGTVSEGRAAAAIEWTVDATVGAEGALSGTISSGANVLSASATKSAASGGSAAFAGLYEAGATGSGAAAFTIVGGDGRAFVMTVGANGADAGTGSVDASGRLIATTAGGAAVSGTIAAASSTLAATVTTAAGATLTFRGGADGRPVTEKLVNLSTRGSASASPLIVGFVVAGDAPKTMLVRAIGPTLQAFGVASALPAARLEIFRGQTSVASAGDWSAGSGAPAIAAAARRVGAFALASGSRDSALALDLAPAAYTAVVTGADGATGVALVEVYDASENATSSQRLVNLATRAGAGAGDSTLIAGFAITGELPKRVLVRAAGPALTAFGVGGVLADPELRVLSGTTIVASNNDWGQDAAIAAAVTQVGAFPFAGGSKDSAILIYLAPGTYTAQVTGVGGTVGTALVEVYEVP